MIELTLSALNDQTLYVSSLNQIEQICDEYSLQNHFGTISMANQELVDFLRTSVKNYYVDLNFCIDNDGISIVYNSQSSIFTEFNNYIQQREIMSSLADEIEINPDNKSVTLTFHVKPLINIGRRTQATISNKTNVIMKNTFALFFMLCISLVSFADNYKVLFLGNSYTDVNNLPGLVKQVCGSVGDEITYSASMPGGCTFQQHLSQSMSYIKEGGWDYVVLQEQSQLPSFPIGQFMNESYPYAKQLCDSIRKYNTNAQIVFYMTWGRKYGDQQNAQYYSVLGTYEGMDSLLYARYMMMAEDNEAIVSPVGALWHYIRDNHSDIELYQSDNSHPSLAGSYAAACSFYTIFTRKSPLQITVNCGVEDAIANTIRQAAQTVVFDSLNKWLFISSPDTMPIDTVSIRDYDKTYIRIYPNPVTNFINIQSDEDLSGSEIIIYDQKGIKLDKREILNQNNEKYDVSALLPGLYLVQIRKKDYIIMTNKILKK